MKIAVVFDTLHPEWEDADYKKEMEAKVEEAEYDVARALLENGHDVRLLGVQEHLPPLLDRLGSFGPKVVFQRLRRVPRACAARVRRRRGARDARLPLYGLVSNGAARGA